MTKINDKTGFVEPKHKYYKIVGVKTSKEFHKKYGTIMLKLNKCLEIVKKSCHGNFFFTSYLVSMSVGVGRNLLPVGHDLIRGILGRNE